MGKLQNKLKWGFDLTDFGKAERFKNVLKQNQLPLSARTKLMAKDMPRRYKVFVWQNKDVKMVTANNPITGKGTDGNEIGYASYMGIEGKPLNVKRLAKSIRKNAVQIKEENPRENPYVWDKG